MKAWWICAVAAAVVVVLLLMAYCVPRSADRDPGGREPGGRDPAARAFSIATLPTSIPTPPAPSPPDRVCAIQLRDVTKETGITFKHTDGSSGRRYIVETMSTGIATFDYDGDGLIDIYFPNGAPLPGYKASEYKADKPPRHALYKNLGGWKFQEVTEQAGVACTAYGMGIVIGDYDDDGNPDIYLNNYGPNVLYRNNGDGTFTDVTQQARVARGDLVGAGVCFLDIDKDGILDLYVGNYSRLDCSAHVPHTDRGFPSYPSPREYTPVPDTLYRNNGDGTFTDVSRQSGIAAHAGRSMGMTCADHDNDGSTDVFICNDAMQNFLFRNDGKGNFQEVGLVSGVALARDGQMLANMAVDAADYDHDGRLDFFTTNYRGQSSMLLRNFGDHMFEDVASSTNASARSLPYVKWGAGFVDFDNDGHPDLFIVNGHTEDNIDARDPGASYRCPNVVLWNTGTGKFVDVSALAGDGLLRKAAGRGVAFDDLDNDGDIDVVVLNSREHPTILRNMLYELGGKNHWLQIRLQGVKTNRDGVGAHVTVVSGGLRQLQEVHSGSGYQSHWGSRLHYGLGEHDRADRIEVQWIGGGTDVVENIKADQRISILEGSAMAKDQSSRSGR